VNPVVGHERFEGWANLIPAKKKKNVMVIGAGPGGMEAARAAALRGHSVTLFEKENELGGQVRIALKGPGKDKIGFIPAYYSHALKTSGVQVETGTQVGEELIRDKKPDVVIVATGATPLMPDIRGIDRTDRVAVSWDVLSGGTQVPGKRVVVAGGGLVGCETALHLDRQGKEVTIIEMMDELACDMEPITRFDFLTEQLPETRIQIMLKRVIAEITDEGVVVLDRCGRKSLVEADSVVIALGACPADSSLEALAKKHAQEVYVIGDCKDPRKIINATFEGASIARLI
jgi:NADPH-dependent 2,4-dienoyl-CoA reductase/sulfur reductase-like enzyme